MGRASANMVGCEPVRPTVWVDDFSRLRDQRVLVEPFILGREQPGPTCTGARNALAYSIVVCDISAAARQPIESQEGPYGRWFSDSSWTATPKIVPAIFPDSVKKTGW